MKSDYTGLVRDKLKSRLNPSKPESPNYGEQAKLSKQLIDLDEHFNSQLRNEDASLNSKMSERWKGKGGGNAGDAIIEGLQSGLNKGSILDDKKRSAKYTAGIEKMRSMVEQTNMDLAKQERIYNAKQDAVPKVLWFTQNMNNMPASDADAYARRFVKEFSDISGSNIEFIGMDNLQKNKWMVKDIDTGDERVFDVIQETLPREVAQQKLMESMPEYQRDENILKADHASQQEGQTLDKQLKREKIDALRQEHQDLQSYKKIEDSVRQETGDSVISLDRFINKPSQWNHAIKGIEKRIEQGNAAVKGMHILDRLDEMVDNKPQLFGTFDAVITNANSSEPTLLSALATRLKVKDEDRADFEEAGKLLTHFYQESLHTLPNGTRANQYIEREFKKGIPSLGQIPEAFRRISGHLRKDFVHPAEVGKKTSEYYQKGLEYKPKIREYSKEITSKDAEKMTTEQLEAELARLKGV